MSVEEDIGALKKGMENVEASSEKTAVTVDKLVTTVTAHTVRMEGRQDTADERHDDLKESHEVLKKRHYQLERDVPSQKKIMAALAGVGLVCSLIGASLAKALARVFPF